MSNLIRINNKLMTKNNKLLTAAAYVPPVPSEWETFYILTYYTKTQDNKIRCYSLGETVDITPTGPITYYTSENLSTPYGTMNFAGATTRYNSTNTGNYWATYTLTDDQANAFINQDLQFEMLIQQTGTGTSSGDGNAQSKLGSTNNWAAFMFPHCNTGGDVEGTFYIPNVTSSISITLYKDYMDKFDTNSQWRCAKLLGTYMADKVTHVCFTYSLKNKKCLFWVDGALSAKYTLGDNFVNTVTSNINNKSWPFTFITNPCQLGNRLVSQWGIRPAVWTEEHDYTPPTAPYLVEA